MGFKFNTLLRAILAGSAGVASATTPVLYASVTTGVAPFGVIFDGVQTTHATITNTFTDLLYFFDFGDGTSANYTYGEFAGATKNRDIGAPITVHVYETPGTYTARMWAWDGTTVAGPVSSTVTVTDPDVVYAGALTTVVSTSGTFTGAPSGSTQVTSSNFSTAMSTYGGSGKRVLFRSGETFTAATGYAVSNSAVNGVYIGKFGGSTKPTIQVTAAGVTPISCNSTAGNASANGWRVTGIKIDANSSAGCIGISMASAQTSSADANVKTRTLGNHVIHDLEVVGALGAVSLGCAHMITSKLNATNINYGVSQAGGIGLFSAAAPRHAVVDSYIDANHGGEHCIRSQGADYEIMLSNTLLRPAATKSNLTLRGWQVATQTNGVVSLYRAARGCLIDMTTMDTAKEAGAYSTVAPQNSSSNEPLMHFVMERCRFDGMYDAVGLKITCDDFVLRGNIFTRQAAAPTANYMVEVSNKNAQMTQQTNNVRIIGNSFYSASAAGCSAVIAQSAVTNVSMTGNVAYAPSSTKTGANNGTAPSLVVDQSVGVTLAYNSSNAQMKSTDPLWVNTAGGRDGFKLQAGSPYVGFVNAAYDIRRVDGGGYLLGTVPTDAGAMNTGSKNTDAWTLVP